MNKKDFIKKRDKEFKRMNNFSRLIYNEVDYISGYCINQHVDFDKAEINDLRLLSENIKTLFLAINFCFLEYADLEKLKKDIVNDFEFYIKSLDAMNKVPINQVLNKIKDIEKELHKEVVLNQDNKPLQNWKNNWKHPIREILSIPNEEYAIRNGYTKVAMTWGVGLFFNGHKLTDDFIDHVDKVQKFILAESDKRS